ncbi:unnamed protein product [Cladocopium goreaui]|uniref:Uncharacterized protein n=1 Tax=Cladocopium goreaui TaxID=2562237 RepID=A0A9P1DFR7_9DINO|nr:unnamed protein product [Cladocopium goreaui]
MLCLLLLHCVFSSATIIRVEEVTSGVEATPVSASLQQLEAGFVPANDDGHWSNHDFLAGITFGVMSSGIIVALLLGCQADSEAIWVAGQAWICRRRCFKWLLRDAPSARLLQ